MPITHLPPRMKPAAYRVRAWAKTDATVLLVLSIACLARAWSNLGHPDNIITHPLEQIVPDWMWLFSWLSVGVIAGVGAFNQDSWVGRAGVGLGVGMHVALAFSYLLASLSPNYPDGMWSLSILPIAIVLIVVWSVWRGHLQEGDTEPLDKGR